MRASFRALLLSAALGLLQSDGGAQPYAEVLSENVVVVAVCVEADPETVGCPHAKVQPKRKPDFAQFFEGVEVLSMAVDGYGKFPATTAFLPGKTPQHPRSALRGFC